MPSSPKRGLTAAEEKTFLRYYVRLLLEDPDKINNLNEEDQAIVDMVMKMREYDREKYRRRIERIPKSIIISVDDLQNYMDNYPEE
jgi:predicted RNA-binding protein YlqC (UPF0109 family)